MNTVAKISVCLRRLHERIANGFPEYGNGDAASGAAQTPCLAQIKTALQTANLQGG